jgi:hypothetical protein
VLALMPVAARGGEAIEVIARRPDRTVEPLAVVRRFEPAYPVTYRFRRPIALTRGTSIDVRSSASPCRAELELAVREREP